MKLYGRLVWYRVCLCPGCSNLDHNNNVIRLARRSVKAKEKARLRKELKRVSEGS